MKWIQTYALNLLIALPIGPAFADSGVWVQESQFAQVNISCFRYYRCSTKQEIVFDSVEHKLVLTAPAKVFGVCSAAGGAVDSCNECLTNEPTTACQWSIEQK